MHQIDRNGHGRHCINTLVDQSSHGFMVVDGLKESRRVEDWSGAGLKVSASKEGTRACWLNQTTWGTKQALSIKGCDLSLL
jgi:hypothetical protein